METLTIVMLYFVAAMNIISGMACTYELFTGEPLPRLPRTRSESWWGAVLCIVFAVLLIACARGVGR